MRPFFVTIPHSGENIPKEASWLVGLPELTLMRDVDRYVDLLYRPSLEALETPHILTPWSRYVIDLNREETEIDQASVQGAEFPRETHPKGLHWSVTTHGEILIKEPMSQKTHQQLLESYYRPFHSEVRQQFAHWKSQGAEKVYHLDAHSMPSLGTSMHPDPGEQRAEIVLGDQKGKSCDSSFLELVVEAYRQSGFQVVINWPYIGGGITRIYGQPQLGQHSLQVELNRHLYMNEETKEKLPGDFEQVSERLGHALRYIVHHLDDLVS